MDKKNINKSSEKLVQFFKNLKSNFLKKSFKNDPDRIIKNIAYPCPKRLNLKEAFDGNKPRLRTIREHFVNEGRLDILVVQKIIYSVDMVLRKEPNLLEISAPVRIIGDIHGQFYDLLKILDIGGNPAFNRYLFLGDYVDRGYFSIECLLYLYCLKIVYPSSVYLLRGNHECRHLTEYFSFKRECLTKYSSEIYQMCINSFDSLPLASIVNGQFFCVHGGLSPELRVLSDINRIDRFREPPQVGLMCDLLWSDPSPDYDNDEYAYSTNPVRGCSYNYSYKAVSSFLNQNKLVCVIRAHEAQNDGFRLYKKQINSKNEFPSLITIFSAPNYLDMYNNKGAIIIYENNIINTKQYLWSEHPYWLPNFIDVFTWSIPFIVEKVTEMLITILNKIDDDDDDQQNVSHRKLLVIKQKIKAINQVVRIYSKVREDSEALLRLHNITPSDVIPLKSLVETKQNENLSKLANKVTNKSYQRRLSFDEAKELDLKNEKFPN